MRWTIARFLLLARLAGAANGNYSTESEADEGRAPYKNSLHSTQIYGMLDHVQVVPKPQTFPINGAAEGTGVLAGYQGVADLKDGGKI